jgi:hypothetical protein
MTLLQARGGRVTLVMTVALALAACAAQNSAAPPPAAPAATPVAAATANATGAAGAAGAPVAGCRVSPVSGCTEESPSFARDVRPILQRRCFRCHSGEGIAAEEHDFSKPEVLHAQRSQVKDEVSTCAMPPRSPLPEDESRTLLRWVECGGHVE